MVHAGWIVVAIVATNALNFLVVRALVAELRAMSLAVIAKNPKELATLQRSVSVPKRTIPEAEQEFADERPRVLGLS